MRFSIITASFNQGRFIRECIESVRSQGVEFEHIVVDACSTDETVDILREYPHLKWTSEPDSGQTDAINKGFRRATGDWMMWLNSDDLLRPGALKRVEEFIAAHSKADVVYGECVFIAEDGTEQVWKKQHRFSGSVLVFCGCYIPSTSCFYHRRVFEQGVWLDPSFKVCMDFDFYVRIMEAGFRFEFIPEALANFRWHDSNISTVYSERRYEERLRVQRVWLEKRGLRWLGGKRTLLAARYVSLVWRHLLKLVRKIRYPVRA
jgi:glycosyltransferase involved in cell wall biosynthesis